MSIFSPKPPPMFPGGAAQMSELAANSSTSPFAPAPGQMNTQQRLDSHYANMVKGFDANPYAGPQVQQSSAQVAGARSFPGASPWGAPQPQAAPQQQSAGGGGGFFSKVASLFAGLF